jgi:signal transduction histidine kinase
MNRADQPLPFELNAELLQAILDSLPVGVWIADASGQLLINNPAGHSIWAGERWLKIDECGEYKGWWSATGKRIEAHDWALARAVERGEVSVNEMIDIECFDGSRKTILNSGMPIHDTDGRLCAVVITNQDITTLKKTQDDLARARNELEALTAELIEVRERERQRIARDLHDGVGQGLSALKMALAGLRIHHGDTHAVHTIERATVIADDLMTEVREMARALRPPQLDDLGLVAALRWHVDRSVRASGLASRFTGNLGETRLPGEIEVAAFRIAQEAISNAVQHAQAHVITILLSRHDRTLELRVEDDGTGFDPQLRAAVGRHHLGLIGMRERIQALGGEFILDSKPNRGTVVCALFPLPDDHA